MEFLLCFAVGKFRFGKYFGKHRNCSTFVTTDGMDRITTFFYSCTETARDLAEDMMNDGSDGDPHPLEQLCCLPEHWGEMITKIKFVKILSPSSRYMWTTSS